MHHPTGLRDGQLYEKKCVGECIDEFEGIQELDMQISTCITNHSVQQH